MKKEITAFEVVGLTVRGVFHKPDGLDGQIPIVVMFNGFATEWQFGTQSFIEQFVANGLATLNFDYRSFGQSDGQPRQLLDIPEQLNDCRAAIQHALSQSWVDNDRLILWGSSLGGGHAISMASEFQPKALVAQVPHCCAREAFKTVSLTSVFTGMGSAIKDAVCSKFGAAPVYLPVVEEPSVYGVMNHPSWKQHYFKLSKDSDTWQNGIVARGLLRGGDYRPITVAETIQSKTLLVAGKQDAGVPFSSVEDTAAKIANCELFAYEGDHFEVYHGDLQSGIVQKQLDFVQDVIKKV